MKKARGKQICSISFHFCEYIWLACAHAHGDTLKIRHDIHQILNSNYRWEVELVRKGNDSHFLLYIYILNGRIMVKLIFCVFLSIFKCRKEEEGEGGGGRAGRGAEGG